MRKVWIMCVVLLAVVGCKSQRQSYSRITVDSVASTLSSNVVRVVSVDSLIRSGRWEFDDVMIAVRVDSASGQSQSVVTIGKAVMSQGEQLVSKSVLTDSAMVKGDVIVSADSRSVLKSVSSAMSPGRWLTAMIIGILALAIGWGVLRLIRRKSRR